MQLRVVDQLLVVQTQHNRHVLIALDLAREHIAEVRVCLTLSCEGLEVVCVCNVQMLHTQTVQGRQELAQIVLDVLSRSLAFRVVVQGESNHLFFSDATFDQRINVIDSKLVLVERGAFRQQSNTVGVGFFEDDVTHVFP